MIEEGKLNLLGSVVVDELHMVSCPKCRRLVSCMLHLSCRGRVSHLTVSGMSGPQERHDEGVMLDIMGPLMSFFATHQEAIPFLVARSSAELQLLLCRYFVCSMSGEPIGACGTHHGAVMSASE